MKKMFVLIPMVLLTMVSSFAHSGGGLGTNTNYMEPTETFGHHMNYMWHNNWVFGPLWTFIIWGGIMLLVVYLLKEPPMKSNSSKVPPQ